MKSGKNPVKQGMVKDLAELLLGEKLPLDLLDGETVVAPAGKKINITMVKQFVDAFNRDKLELDPSPIRNRILMLLEQSKHVHTRRAEEAAKIAARSNPGPELY